MSLIKIKMVNKIYNYSVCYVLKNILYLYIYCIYFISYEIEKTYTLYTQFIKSLYYIGLYSVYNSVCYVFFKLSKYGLYPNTL